MTTTEGPTDGTPGEAAPGDQMLLVVEGNPGTGKSSLASRVAAALGATSFHFPQPFVRLREEADLDTGVAPRPRLFYYLAGTLHLGQLVSEALEDGPVVSDRYAASPIALLLADGAVTPDEVERWWDPHEAYLPVPSLTVYLHCGYRVARERIRRRAAATGAGINPVNRRVITSPGFYAAMEQALRERVSRFGRVLEVDTTDRLTPAIFADVLQEIPAGVVTA